MLVPINDFKSIFKPGKTTVDNGIFRLHYQVTGLILIVFSIWVTSFQYIGDPIDCIASKSSDKLDKMLDTYCWIHSTYSLPSAWNKTVGVEVAHPGVDTVTDKNQHEVKYHKYYQWTCFVLFFQAVMFFIPRFIWKSIERSRVRNMVLQLNMPIVEKDRDIKIDMLADYFVTTMELNSNKGYAIGYYVCEVLNFINVVGQMFLVDAFLGGEFSKYGPQVVQYSKMEQEDRVDPMIRVFPRMTKCNFYSYGTSGDVQRIDALCMLPLNVINEKIYIFCWFWFVCVAIVSGLGLLWRIPLIAVTKLRVLTMTSSYRYSNRGYLESFVRKGNIGDYMLLYFLGKNIDCLHFKRLVDKIGPMLNGHKTDGSFEETLPLRNQNLKT